jgi:hypothetical protein
VSVVRADYAAGECGLRGVWEGDGGGPVRRNAVGWLVRWGGSALELFAWERVCSLGSGGRYAGI